MLILSIKWDRRKLTNMNVSAIGDGSDTSSGKYNFYLAFETTI